MAEVFHDVEIVRLRAAAGREDALLAFLDGHACFAQPELTARILAPKDGREVVLVIDWADAEAPKRALSSPAGEAFREGLKPLLSGPPEMAYYRDAP
ncbi:putative quinol monooxygenase [Streptomyces sp. 6N223]|uniref:putative quinol monooxygenase n=1 Tax=Streptomyces sp. 6N223 TaxID=3457412 RepID=UPI003FD52EEA